MSLVRILERQEVPGAAVIDERVAVVGLGYVGLPVALAMARVARKVVGFDTCADHVAAIAAGRDPNGESLGSALDAAKLDVTGDPDRLSEVTVFILAVPTPIDLARRPDLTAVTSACRTIGPHLSRGAIVVLESTVYPGVTEDVCGPVLEAASGLTAGQDFFLAYSPERINPGDQEHQFETITKVVSAQSPEALDRVAALYGAAVTAGIYRAPSIRVAEAAKVIENIQRDINIAFMNELSMLFERLDISTEEVLQAARTKWNFLPFRPGLVGGHCIGVDPYYLACKAQEVGIHPEIMLAGRRINDNMPHFVAERCLKMMAARGMLRSSARVGVLGLTFKPDVSDIRNTLVPEVVEVLQGYGLQTVLHDPNCDAGAVRRHYDLEVVPMDALNGVDALILAVPHRAYLEDLPNIAALTRREGSVLDLMGAAPALRSLRPDLGYWAL